MSPAEPMPGSAKNEGAENEGAMTEDSLLDGRIRLRQPAAGYRVAIDPVLLAAAVAARPDERVLDLGCGAGAAALCLLARDAGPLAVGLELDRGQVALARDNAALNRLSDRFQVVAGDVLAPTGALARDSFDQVLCNPPHLAARGATAPKDAARARAMHEGAAGLAVWIDAALALLRAKGAVTFIHRADRLDELLSGLHGRAGEVVIFPLWPAAGKPAKRVIVRARKAVAAPARLSAGLVLHQADGAFTPEAEAVLRHAQALRL